MGSWPISEFVVCLTCLRQYYAVSSQQQDHNPGVLLRILRLSSMDGFSHGIPRSRTQHSEQEVEN
jgi:hypothetical protein